MSDKFFNQEHNLEFWNNCQKIRIPVFDKKGKLTAVNVYMEKNGDLRVRYEPNDNDFSRNSG